MLTLYYESSIMHHGIKGMKWGIRKQFDATDKQVLYERKRSIKSLERGKKLYNEGYNVDRYTAKQQIIKESVSLGSSVLRTTLIAAGLSTTPMAMIPVGVLSAGQLAYNIIQNKYVNTRLNDIQRYTDSIKTSKGNSK